MKILKLKNHEVRPDFFTGKIIWDSGTVAYYLNGEFHREDGPALIYGDNSMYGPKVKRWYLHKSYYIKIYQTCDQAGKKEDWFELLTPEQKIIALFNEENW